ncbi:MAG TPA: KH domain-containing protein, partial [Myxococcaceae bacterium]|nr:KH domain-containing protein [Myxococcaceae bacterium]
GLVRIHATIHLERESQKAIVIGRRGQMLKAIGSDARREIEQLLNARVYLSLSVRVEPKWSERPEALKKLGYQ